ncbi:MAG: lipase family protein, partial [Actinomycetota bacterium]|nr:lipase family protein [Actinomycetota bacterium]
MLNHERRARCDKGADVNTRRRLATAVAAVSVMAMLLVATGAGAPANASPVALAAGPATGPALSVPQAKLDASISCRWVDAAHRHEPVLLVHGTIATAAENWGWNYQRVLPTKGFDTCVVQMPNRSLDDIQASSEYVVNAIRRVNQWSSRKVDVIGHSQGGLQPRWAIKYWPDVRQRVDDFVMLGAPNHGTYVANVLGLAGCTGACLQMKAGSRFLHALNAGDETPGSVSYTSIYTATDELVQPSGFPSTTAALSGGRNVLVQSLCPGRIVGHLGLVDDGVVYDAVID